MTTHASTPQPSSTHPSSTHPSSTRRVVRSLALTLSAAALATAASVGLGTAPQPAQADPGDTFVAIGSSQLVQSEDLSSIQVPLDTATVRVNHDDDFSSCLGEGNSWTSVLQGSPKPIMAAWTRAGHDDQSLYESIAQAKTTAKAKAYEKTLVNQAIRTCQQPVYDFHYGALQTSRVGSGHATWALTYRGQEKRPSGGVVVIRKGTNVGLVTVNGAFGTAGQTMESVAKVATDRLVLSQPN